MNSDVKITMRMINAANATQYAMLWAGSQRQCFVSAENTLTHTHTHKLKCIAHTLSHTHTHTPTHTYPNWLHRSMYQDLESGNFRSRGNSEESRVRVLSERTLHEVTRMYGQDVMGLTQTFHRMITTLMRDNDIRAPCMQPLLDRMNQLISTARIPRVILDLARDRESVPQDRIRNSRI